MERNIYKIGKELFITNDEEIKEGDYGVLGKEVLSYHQMHKKWGMPQGLKIILTTDPSLVPYVQSIDDEFLEWFVKNPSCEEVKVFYDLFEFEKNNISKKYVIIIPKEEPKRGHIKSKTEFLGVEFTLEDGSKQFVPNLKEEPKQETLEEAGRLYSEKVKSNKTSHMLGFYNGAKWQAERMYSEKDMRLAINKARDISDGKDCFDAEDISGCTEVCTYGWKFNMSEDLIIEQFKKK